MQAHFPSSRKRSERNTLINLSCIQRVFFFAKQGGVTLALASQRFVAGSGLSERSLSLSLSSSAGDALAAHDVEHIRGSWFLLEPVPQNSRSVNFGILASAVSGTQRSMQDGRNMRAVRVATDLTTLEVLFDFQATNL